MGNLAFAELAQPTSPKPLNKGGIQARSWCQFSSNEKGSHLNVMRRLNLEFQGMAALRAKRKDITSSIQDDQLLNINIKSTIQTSMLKE